MFLLVYSNFSVRRLGRNYSYPFPFKRVIGAADRLTVGVSACVCVPTTRLRVWRPTPTHVPRSKLRANVDEGRALN